MHQIFSKGLKGASFSGHSFGQKGLLIRRRSVCDDGQICASGRGYDLDRDHGYGRGHDRDYGREHEHGYDRDYDRENVPVYEHGHDRDYEWWILTFKFHVNAHENDFLYFLNESVRVYDPSYFDASAHVYVYDFDLHDYANALSILLFHQAIFGHKNWPIPPPLNFIQSSQYQV